MPRLENNQKVTGLNYWIGNRVSNGQKGIPGNRKMYLSVFQDPPRSPTWLEGCNKGAQDAAEAGGGCVGPASHMRFILNMMGSRGNDVF